MGDLPNLRDVRAVAHILLICPDCGQENREFADKLRAASTYYCKGDGCDYIFDLAPGRRTDFGKGFVDACKRFYAAFHAMRG
jgi:rubredoxin